MPANRRNPGVHHTARQSRDREGALADSVAGMRSRPRGHPVAARIGASRASTFMSRARLPPNRCFSVCRAIERLNPGRVTRRI